MSTDETNTLNTGSHQSFEALVVGAGFAGMYMLHRLRAMGVTVRVYEAGTEVGGTWYWNRYPGARCDVESMQYSYSFSDELQQEWKWSELYSSQPEILSYAKHVADRFDLRRDIVFETRVVSAVFDEAAKRWTVTADNGDVVSAKYCIMGTGCLSAPRTPDIEGIATFAGDSYHTAQWPREGVDFTGRRVGVIGTGSTGIQLIPMIARQAAHVYVFQRTPNFSIPARNRSLDPEIERHFKLNYPSLRQQMRHSKGGTTVFFNPRSAMEVSEEERHAEYSQRWNSGGATFIAAYSDLLTNRTSNDTAAEFVRQKIKSIVKNPDVAEALAPKDHPIGTKRICVDTGYYETYNRDNVTLVDVRRAPIAGISGNTVRTCDNKYPVDCLIYATGFDAMTGTLLNIDIRGRHYRPLSEKWAHGPLTYLGLSISGFPNLFVIAGPGSPSVQSNMIMSIEQHVEWIADCIGYMAQHRFDCIEATEQAQDNWVAHVNEVANATLLPQANSWYVGANIPGKPRVFMPYAGGVGVYRKRCDEVAARGYEGFTLNRNLVE